MRLGWAIMASVSQKFWQCNARFSFAFPKEPLGRSPLLSLQLFHGWFRLFHYLFCNLFPNSQGSLGRQTQQVWISRGKHKVDTGNFFSPPLFPSPSPLSLVLANPLSIQIISQQKMVKQHMLCLWWATQKIGMSILHPTKGALPWTEDFHSSGCRQREITTFSVGIPISVSHLGSFQRKNFTHVNVWFTYPKAHA